MNENKPEVKFSTGAIVATVWKNAAKTKEGKDSEYRSVSLQRRYKDKNDQWQSSSSLRVNDLPKAALVLHEAYKHIVMKDSAISEQVNEAFEEVVM